MENFKPPLLDNLYATSANVVSESWNRWFTSIGRTVVTLQTDVAAILADNSVALPDVSTLFTTTLVNGQTLSANRILTITPADANQTFTITGSPTLNGGTHSGTNTGDQTITLTGGVTGSGTGSFAATVVTNANLTGEVTSTGNAAVIDKTAITNRSADATPDTAADYVLTYDASAAALKKVLLSNLGNGGSDHYILSQTASSSTSVDFSSSVLTGYTHYEIRISGMIPATDSSDLYIRVSTDGGSTFKSGASDYCYASVESNTTNTYNNAATAAEIFAANNIDNAAAYLAGIIVISKPAGGFYTSITGVLSSINGAGTADTHTFSGKYLATTTVDGIRFLMNSGNITQGRFDLYGID